MVGNGFEGRKEGVIVLFLFYADLLVHHGVLSAIPYTLGLVDGL